MMYLKFIVTKKEGYYMTNNKITRRSILKKTAAFILPTIVTFKISALKVQASGTYRSVNSNQGTHGDNGNHFGQLKNGNKGNHYGQNK